MPYLTTIDYSNFPYGSSYMDDGWAILYFTGTMEICNTPAVTPSIYPFVLQYNTINRLSKVLQHNKASGCNTYHLSAIIKWTFCSCNVDTISWWIHHVRVCVIVSMDEEYRFVEPRSTIWTLLHTGKENHGGLVMQHGIKCYFFFFKEMRMAMMWIDQNKESGSATAQETWIMK